MVKRRFPLIGSVVRLKTERVPKVIIACFVLHNIALDHADGMPEDAAEEDQEPDVEEEFEDQEGMGEAAVRRLGQERRDNIAERLYNEI